MGAIVKEMKCEAGFTLPGFGTFRRAWWLTAESGESLRLFVLAQSARQQLALAFQHRIGCRGNQMRIEAPS
jgi:hypothetical protein